MWEWLWWTGLITFSLIVIEALFVFDFFLVLITEIIGIATLVWIRFLRFPPMLEAYQARLARERYYTSRSSRTRSRRSRSAADGRAARSQKRRR